MRHSARRGVTLIEVVVAVTLLSLLSLGILYAMRVGLSAFSKTDARLMDDRRVAGAQTILLEELEGMMPVVTPCGAGESAGPRVAFFDAQPQSMRLVSTFSLQEGWRGQPQILEFMVIPGQENRGVRLVVNETPYGGIPSVAPLCTGLAPDPVSGLAIPSFAPASPGPKSFVLADKLAYCRFSYLVTANEPDERMPLWNSSATRMGWPFAIRVEMRPLEPDPSRLQPITVTAPIHLYRSPGIPYVD